MLAISCFPPQAGGLSTRCYDGENFFDVVGNFPPLTTVAFEWAENAKAPYPGHIAETAVSPFSFLPQAPVHVIPPRLAIAMALKVFGNVMFAQDEESRAALTARMPEFLDQIALELNVPVSSIGVTANGFIMIVTGQ